MLFSNTLFTYSQEDLQLALDCLYDTEALANNNHLDIVCMVQMDALLQDQLHWLAHCDWDLAQAALSYKLPPHLEYRK